MMMTSSFAGVHHRSVELAIVTNEHQMLVPEPGTRYGVPGYHTLAYTPQTGVDRIYILEYQGLG